MTNNVNFDELAAKSFAPDAGESDFENLFAAAFSLDSWYFIADDKFDYKIPYRAMFPAFFGEAVAVTVFTDGERAMKFIAEKGIKTSASAGNPNAPNAPEDLILRISTNGILDFLDRLAAHNVSKIFFNPNKDSQGFHNNLKMMRPIYEHLENKGLLAKPAAANSSGNLDELLRENADVIADFERENAMFSAIIAGSAAAMDEQSEAENESTVSSTAEMFESVRVQQNMSPKLFRAYIETCLEKRKFLMPTLAFAYFQQEAKGIKKLEKDKELADDMAKFLIKKAIPDAALLMDETPQNQTAEREKDFSTNENSGEISPAESGVDFDALAKKALETNAMEDLNALFGATFALEKWNFISRGELPDIYPYIASNAAVAGNQPMIRAFTDTNRLMRFARENNLTEADGSCPILSVPTKNIVDYLESFIAHGASGVWFNSDSESDGFFIPIKQLRIIREHLAKLDPPPKSTVKTALLIVQDGLGFPSGFVSQARYKLNIFCRVPSEWTAGEQLTADAQERIFEFLYGANWRNGNDDGSRYVVIDAFSKVFDEETVSNTRWEGTENTDENHYRFYLAGEDGAIRSVAEAEFQADIDSGVKNR